MNHRLGTCSSCKAQYKVPASFQADRAKCKSCGGVVEIGPVVGAAPAAAAKPAAAPAPKPAAAAAPARPVPPRPASAAAPKPVVKPVAKPVAEEKDSVRAAAAAAAERVRDAGRKRAVVEEVPAVEGKAGARERSKSKSGTGKRAVRKEQPKAPMLAAVVVLLVAGGGGTWFFMRGDDGGSKAAEKGAASAAAPAGSAHAQPEAAPDVALAETHDASAAAPEAAAPAAVAGGAESAPEPTPVAKPADEEGKDIDLTVFPDEPKLPGTSDADWASIQEWTRAFLDANSGAAGNRARAKLAERGREAFPAVLNAMKVLDFSSEDGFRAGDLSQRLLMDICNGQNFDWKYDRQPADVIFNKKVVRSWIKAWEKGRETPKEWAKMTKTAEADAIKLFAVTGPFENASGDDTGTSSALDDL